MNSTEREAYLKATAWADDRDPANGWTYADAVAAHMAGQAAALAQPTAEPPAPELTDEEITQLIEVAGITVQDVGQAFALVQLGYAAAPALLPAPADVTDAQGDSIERVVSEATEAQALRAMLSKTVRVLDALRTVGESRYCYVESREGSMVRVADLIEDGQKALGATCPASHGDSDA